MADQQQRPNDPGETERLRELLFGEERALLRALEAQTQALEERVGDDEALAESVRRVIVDVLQESGIKDHERVAEALAPLVMHTVAKEVPRHSQNIAQGLRPHARNLLRIGIKGTVTQAASGVESVASPFLWSRRAVALVQGRSLSSARLGSRLWLEGSILVDRNEAEVLFSDFPGRRAEQIVQQALPLVAEAMLQDGFLEPVEGKAGRERFWITGDAQFAWIVIAQGRPPLQFKARLATVFERFARQWRDALVAADHPLGPSLRANIKGALEDGCLEHLGTAPGHPPPSPRPWFGYLVLAACMVVLVGFGGFKTWQALENREVLARADTALALEAQLADLPLSLEYDPDRERLTVRGVAGQQGLQEQVSAALTKALPDLAVDVILIEPPPAITPIEAPKSGTLDEDQIKALFARLNALQSELVKTSIPVWFERQSILFTGGTRYADEPLVREQLKGMAQVFQDWPTAVYLRVVGYSDNTGTEFGQDGISLARAARVVEDLVAAGAPSGQLSAIGRGSSRRVSIVHGEGSLNRRVEFEVYTPAPSAE